MSASWSEIFPDPQGHRMSRKLFHLAIVCVIGFLIWAIVLGGVVLATGTAVDCTNPDTGTWSIFNERDTRSLTFTTDQGHSGEVGPRETVTVQYFGTSLTVFSTLDNGVERTNTGRGDCFPEDTPSTTTPTTPERSSPCKTCLRSTPIVFEEALSIAGRIASVECYAPND